MTTQDSTAIFGGLSFIFVNGQEDTVYDGKGEAKKVDGGAIAEEAEPKPRPVKKLNEEEEQNAHGLD